MFAGYSISIRAKAMTFSHGFLAGGIARIFERHYSA